MRRWLVGLGVLLAARGAVAQTTRPLETLRLSGGGLLRGTVIEIVPNQSYRIQLPDGEVRTVPFDQVVGYEPAPAVPPAAPAAPPSPARPPGPQEHAIWFETSIPNQRIEVVSGSASGVGLYGGYSIEGRRLLCISPCTTRMPAGTYEFRVGGRVIRPIGIESGGAVLSFRLLSTQGAKTAGVVLAAVGASTVLGGGLAAWVVAQSRAGDGSVASVGPILIAVGAAMALVGALVASQRTYTLTIRGHAHEILARRRGPVAAEVQVGESGVVVARF